MTIKIAIDIKELNIGGGFHIGDKNFDCHSGKKSSRPS